MRQAAKRQNRQVGRAICLLFCFIIIGTCVANIQLNGLTLESDFSKILNIRYNQGSADELNVYVLGESMTTDKLNRTQINKNFIQVKRIVKDYWQTAELTIKNINQLVIKYYTEF